MTDEVGRRYDRLTMAEVVAELIAVLGAPLVAVLADVTDTQTVQAWSLGELTPRLDDRLRYVLRVIDVLKLQRNDVARACFGGVEPNLGEQNPAMLLVAHDDAITRKRILDAARQFISENM